MDDTKNPSAAHGMRILPGVVLSPVLTEHISAHGQVRYKLGPTAPQELADHRRPPQSSV